MQNREEARSNRSLKIAVITFSIVELVVMIAILYSRY